jgi:hypothetical protein
MDRDWLADFGPNADAAGVIALGFAPFVPDLPAESALPSRT